MGFEGMGDRVSRGYPYVQIEGLEKIIDVKRFLSRVAEIETTPTDDKSRTILARFREGMRRREDHRARRSDDEKTNSAEPNVTGENEEKEEFGDALITGERSDEGECIKEC